MNGLVLEGGASRGYFSAGVMDALLDIDINFSYVIGASAGIANAVSYVSKQKGRNLIIGRDYLHDKRYMGIRHLFNLKNKSYYNIDFVFNKIPNKYLPFDYEEFSHFNGDVIAAVTNVDTGVCEYIKIDSSDKKWRSIVASCSLPLLFKPVKINGRLYLDGGISNPIPYSKAISDGCDKLLIVLTREREYKKSSELGADIAGLSYHKYPAFVHALKMRSYNYNLQREEIFILEKERKVLVITPDDTSSWNRTERDSQKIVDIYNQGLNKTLSMKNEILNYFSVNARH